MVLVPSFSPPLRFTRVLALQGIFPVSSLLSSFLPPLRPYPCILPPPSSSVWSFIVRPSEVFRPPADGQPMSSPGFLYSGPYVGLHPPPTCAAGCTWLGCGRRGKGDGTPTMVWIPSTRRQATPGLACCLRRSSPLFDSCGARLSFCPPPPLSPYNRTCPYTLPPNGRVFL